MVICHKRKICFIHIPKTGGTSIETFLDLMKPANLYGVKNGKAQQHLDITEIKRLYPNIEKTHFIFSITRHPYTRVVSDYSWCCYYNHFNINSVNSYLDLVEKVVNNNLYNTNLYYDHFKPQYQFIYENGILKTHYLGKLEEMDAVFKMLRDKYGLQKPDIHTNKTSSKLELTKGQKERIYKLYKKDFELFGYEP